MHGAHPRACKDARGEGGPGKGAERLHKRLRWCAWSAIAFFRFKEDQRGQAMARELTPEVLRGSGVQSWVDVLSHPDEAKNESNTLPMGFPQCDFPLQTEAKSCFQKGLGRILKLGLGKTPIHTVLVLLFWVI